jgi:hypothetical protein
MECPRILGRMQNTWTASSHPAGSMEEPKEMSVWSSSEEEMERREHQVQKLRTVKEEEDRSSEMESRMRKLVEEQKCKGAGKAMGKGLGKGLGKGILRVLEPKLEPKAEPIAEPALEPLNFKEEQAMLPRERKSKKSKHAKEKKNAKMKAKRRERRRKERRAKGSLRVALVHEMVMKREAAEVEEEDSGSNSPCMEAASSSHMQINDADL